MQLQVAVDRLSLDEALVLAVLVHPYADWIEVGTSLIKEFGMEAVRQMRRMLPGMRLLADCKTVDEGRYEFELCYAAGADSATVMALAPDATLHACAAVARRLEKQVAIDLHATGRERQEHLLRTFDDARFDWHAGKDTQAAAGARADVLLPHLPAWAATRTIAVAGGIELGDIPVVGARFPMATVVIGSAIIHAPDPGAAARAFADALAPFRTKQGSARWGHSGRS